MGDVGGVYAVVIVVVGCGDGGTVCIGLGKCDEG